MNNFIPKRFIRVWLGPKSIPDIFEEWWQDFKNLHPDYEFVTITDNTELILPKHIEDIYLNVDTYAGRSDIIRLVALYSLGGVYVDTDVMPIKKFDDLLKDPNPFAGLRSSKSFESAVIGCPAKHKAMKDLIDSLPEWYNNNVGRSTSVQTGPGFLSSVWFGRGDVRHLPIKTFYPYNGFMAPKRQEKQKIFQDKSNFPEEMIAAHFSNHSWGGKPKK